VAYGPWRRKTFGHTGTSAWKCRGG
jgi:hypothetical protein